MKKVLIAVSAKNDSGKTTLLKRLIELLPTENLQLFSEKLDPVDTMPIYKDCGAISIIKRGEMQKRIGVFTYGDSTSLIMKGIEYMQNLGPIDVLIVATRSIERQGSSLKTLIEYAEKDEYKLFVMSPVTEWFGHKDYISYVNDVVANSILEMATEIAFK